MAPIIVPRGNGEAKPGVTFSSRAYQLEMFEESLKKNLIVVMSTGSGKTHVAALRIKRELEVASPGKIIWFLTPTVDLCKQQHRDLHQQIPYARIRQLTSQNNVQMWQKATWDAVLAGLNIAVSTYDVLGQALSHAFVKMESLALIVFDEVHNCTGQSAGSKIMRDFYHRNKQSNKPVPHILGLTANAASSPRRLEALEALLDSICKSPQVQKKELLAHVNRPDVESLIFKNEETPSRLSVGLPRLRQLQGSLPLSEDPYIVQLQGQTSPAARHKLDKALETGETPIRRQMKSLCGVSARMQGELGGWAADEYISLAVQNIIRTTTSPTMPLTGWEASDQGYLADALRRVALPARTTPDLTRDMSVKMHTLTCFLEGCSNTTTGILFAKERATTHMLFRLLSHHAGICKLFRMGVVVGQSNSPKKKRDVADGWDPEDHSQSLDRFRRGEINLLIATSVLEEGIDVPQCNLVVCFDKPERLTSYVQRRGRARTRGSRYVILLDDDSAGRQDWDEMERIMREECGAADREMKKLPEHEARDGLRGRQIRAAGTDALLDLDGAKGHLQHFCAKLRSSCYSDARPEYIIQKHEDATPGGLVRFSAKVILPASVPRELREACSKERWESEKYATKDAALEACFTLYKAGLLNDHFLPLESDDGAEHAREEDAVIDIREQFTPWPEIAQARADGETLSCQKLTLRDGEGLTLCEADMHIAVLCPTQHPFPLYWDANTEWRLEIGPPAKVERPKMDKSDTSTLLRAAYGHRWEISEGKHVVDFILPDSLGLPLQEQSKPLKGNNNDTAADARFLVRDVEDRNRPYFQVRPPDKSPGDSIQPAGTSGTGKAEEQALVELRPWPRRRDFLHRPPPRDAERAAPLVALPADRLTMDVLPVSYAQLGLLIPSITHRVEVNLVAAKLRKTLLACVPIARPDLLLTALCAPAAREGDNYQTLEFFGDSVLKYIASVFLMSKYTIWPEGYLSRRRARIVSNARLCDAALACGLDEFILTTPFTGKGWRPLYVADLSGTGPGCKSATRSVARKTVADVVEALIGAGWRMGADKVALSVARVLIPEMDLTSLETARLRLLAAEPADEPASERLRLLQQLLGYSFRKTSLLVQATTHASDVKAHASYERLEFLGDAVLEMVVAHELAQNSGRLALAPARLHAVRQALVNTDYLGFLALEWSLPQTRTDVEVDYSGREARRVVESRLCLGDFLGFGSEQVGDEQQASVERHAALRGRVLEALESGPRYPWVLLASLRPNKFLADVVESTLAAVWADSGSLAACGEVAARMGMLRHLRRLVRDDVDAVHPKDELHQLTGGDEVEFRGSGTEAECSCSIYVNGGLVADATGCRSASEAKVKASDMGVAFIKAQGKPQRRECLEDE